VISATVARPAKPRLDEGRFIRPQRHLNPDGGEWSFYAPIAGWLMTVEASSDREAEEGQKRIIRRQRRDRPRSRDVEDRLTGGAVMQTIACYMELLRPGEKTRAHRRVCCSNYHVVEGVGYSVIEDRRLDWEDKDVFTVPTWTFCEHVNSGDRTALLFSFTDAPVMRALGLYRDEIRS
jgi:gentisate 1,2-dioxygenase